MYIVMIIGSPHRHRTSALLANEFIRGGSRKWARCDIVN